MPFITREKLKKPRILLIDFDKEVEQRLAEKDFNIIYGRSELSGSPYDIPKHPSEIEIIFWDYSKNRDSAVSREIGKNLKVYFDYVRHKSGFVTIFMGKEGDQYDILSSIVSQHRFLFVRRETETIFSESQEDYIGKFLMRFTDEKNITHSITWLGNEVGYTEYLKDEAGHAHAGYNHRQLLILPPIEKKAEAILSLLQDFLPFNTPDKIFPEQARFNWLNEDDFVYPTILEKRNKIERLINEYKEKLETLQKEIEIEEVENGFFNQALVSDDSDLFPNDKKLSRQIIKILKTIGFEVEDVDTKNKEEGKSLKEDIQITDDVYFGLGEIKGTEQGAKASWVKKDFESHRSIYTRIHEKNPSEVNGMIIFNHERRKDPRERQKPFESDPELLRYAELTGITLVPVYDLYKLGIDVKVKRITKQQGMSLLKKSGLFIYPKNS